MSARPSTVDVCTADGAALASVVVARGPLAKLRGLIGRSLGDGEGMLFPGTSSVHTHLMRYPIDVLYLTADGEVAKVVHALRPWRFSWGGRAARATLELPAGTAAAAGLTAGQRLRMDERAPAKASL